MPYLASDPKADICRPYTKNTITLRTGPVRLMCLASYYSRNHAICEKDGNGGPHKLKVPQTEIKTRYDRELRFPDMSERNEHQCHSSRRRSDTVGRDLPVFFLQTDDPVIQLDREGHKRAVNHGGSISWRITYM